MFMNGEIFERLRSIAKKEGHHAGKDPSHHHIPMAPPPTPETRPPAGPGDDVKEAKESICRGINGNLEGLLTIIRRPQF